MNKVLHTCCDVWKSVTFENGRKLTFNPIYFTNEFCDHQFSLRFFRSIQRLQICKIPKHEIGTLMQKKSGVTELVSKIDRIKCKRSAILVRHRCHRNSCNTISIGSTSRLECYSMHNFTFIPFRIIDRLKFAFFHFPRIRREPPWVFKFH